MRPLPAALKRALSASVVVAGCAGALAPAARAQNGIDAEAQGVLAAMSSHLGNLPRFSVDYAAVDEVVTQEGEKLQFFHSGQVTVQRPDRVYAVQRGAAQTAEMFFDGSTLALFSREAGAFLQLQAAGLPAAIETVHRLGFDAPGADLLGERPLDPATMDMRSGTHVGMTFIDDTEVHHLAFRGAEVDWQLWITAGERPLPLRYVITSKTLGGAPEYVLQLRNWNLAPQIDEAHFSFTPPPGAASFGPASVTVNAIGDMTVRR
jgi:hypothetical protein